MKQNKTGIFFDQLNNIMDSFKKYTFKNSRGTGTVRENEWKARREKEGGWTSNCTHFCREKHGKTGETHQWTHLLHSSAKCHFPALHPCEEHMLYPNVFPGQEKKKK